MGLSHRLPLGAGLKRCIRHHSVVCGCAFCVAVLPYCAWLVLCDGAIWAGVLLQVVLQLACRPKSVPPGQPSRKTRRPFYFLCHPCELTDLQTQHTCYRPSSVSEWICISATDIRLIQLPV